MLWDQSRTRALGSGYISARISNIPYAVKRENLKCMGMMLDNLCHITTVLSDRQGALIGQFKTGSKTDRLTSHMLDIPGGSWAYSTSRKKYGDIVSASWA